MEIVRTQVRVSLCETYRGYMRLSDEAENPQPVTSFT
jgi:hypothetical protein